MSKLFVLIILFVSYCNQKARIIEIKLNEIEIKSYKSQKDIFKADSVLAIAMLLNRECPECSFVEKQYLASCVITGAKQSNVSWKDYLFNMGQFWGFEDKKITYDANNSNHIENLLASQYAWETPKPVRFYASSIDKSCHYRSVKSNGFRAKGFYHYYSFSLR